MSQDIPARPLSRRQRDVLRVIVRFQRATGESPSERYVARKLALHLATVQQHIEALYAKGWLRSASPAGTRCLHFPR